MRCCENGDAIKQKSVPKTPKSSRCDSAMHLVEVHVFTKETSEVMELNNLHRMSGACKRKVMQSRVA